MPPQRVLPDDSILLRERDFEGLSLGEIAERYGVSKSAVSQRFTNMGRPFGGNAAMDYQEIIPWNIQRAHMPLDAANRLRSHVRYRSGIEVAESAERRLKNWWNRLQAEDVVLTYEPDADTKGSPWRYVPREPSDGRLIIRWPEHVEPPTDQQRLLLSLPLSLFEPTGT
jgi:transcriptional regulator with XRE-family HTH domain